MTLHFSGLLLRFVGYERRISVSAPTLGEALGHVEQRYPELRGILRLPDGGLRSTNRIFVNGEMAPDASLDTRLDDHDDVEFLVAIAGG